METGGQGRVYEVEAVGRPQTRQRVEAPWTPADQHRLRAWLAWSATVTLALVLVLLALASFR